MRLDLRFGASRQAFGPWSEGPAELEPSGRRSRTVHALVPVPNLLPDSARNVQRIPSDSEGDVLLRRLTQRDVAMLSALDQHRYLDQGQMEDLFFPSERATQLRIRWLRDQGLILRWLRLRPQTWLREPSVLALSSRGAWLLSSIRGEGPRAAMQRSRHAASHRYHLAHDIEANGLFVGLAAAARLLDDEGLYHWMGEWASRLAYRERGAAFFPDGWGRFISPSGEVVLLLEWDRGTESPRRLGVKVSQYVSYFSRRKQAALSNVLFVTPNSAREETVRDSIRRRLPAHQQTCCTFWTADLSRLAESGPLGPIWRPLRGESGRPTALVELPSHPRSPRRVEDCVGKPGWWLRRPGGGEGA